MKSRGVWSALLVSLLLAGTSGMSMADRGRGGHRGHSHIGVGIAVNPFWFDPWYYPRPYYYPPYYYYPPAMVAVPSAPPVYIEREDGSPPVSEASAYWYYCASPQGYYPYVKQCNGNWQAVAPREER